MFGIKQDLNVITFKTKTVDQDPIQTVKKLSKHL